MLGQIELGVVQVWRGAPACPSARNELLVVQADAMNAPVVQPVSGGFNHRGRAAQIDVSVAAAQHVFAQQVGDESDRPVPLRVRARDDQVHLQVRDTSCQRRELVELAQVLEVGHPVEQMDRLCDIGFQARGHRQDRRQTGAAGHQDHRSHHGAQVEAALAAPQRNAVTGLCPVAQIVRHHALR